MYDKKTEALKKALEWHEWIHSGKSVGYAPCCSNDVMNSIREALAEQPASKPLTDEEILDEVKAADLDWQTGWSLDDDASNRYITFARAIEAAHGIGKGDA